MIGRLAVLVTLAAAATSCASAPEDPNAPQACVVIDNREGGGSVGRAFLVTQARERIRIGEVPVGREVRHCLRRSSFDGMFYLLIEDPGADRMDPAMRQNQPGARRSDEFFITPGDEVVWILQTNRISVRPIGSGGV